MHHPHPAAMPGDRWPHHSSPSCSHTPGDEGKRGGGLRITPTYPSFVSRPLLTWPRYLAAAFNFPIRAAAPRFHHMSPHPRRHRKEGKATSSHPLHPAETPQSPAPIAHVPTSPRTPASAPALAPDDTHLCAGCHVASTTAGYPRDSIWIRSCTVMASNCLCVCTCTHPCAIMHHNGEHSTFHRAHNLLP